MKIKIKEISKFLDFGYSLLSKELTVEVTITAYLLEH
jgi:hypothetical protein